MIRMMCGVRLVDRVSTDVLQDRVGCCKDRGYDNSKPSAVVWSCHACPKTVSTLLREST